MTMKLTQDDFKHIIAFEVAKHELVVHTLPADAKALIANAPQAIRRLLKAELKRQAGSCHDTLLVVCEATGGYERHVLNVCIELGLSVHRAHGSRVRHFAKYLGLAKTDAIDARMLALYGLRSENLRLYEPPSPVEQALRELQARREQLQANLIAESNRLEHARHAAVLRTLKAHIAGLRRMLATVEAEIATLLREHRVVARKAKLMQSVKGIGPVTTTTLLACMPELGRMTKSEVARLAGLAPMNQDSGKQIGRRRIEAGRASVRRCLYMAAIVAIRYNPAMADFAARLRARGKPSRVVITAVMRKLIVILNGVLRSGEPWRGTSVA